MRKGLAVLLVFGLLLMGVTPVLAAGERVKAAAPARQGEVVQVVVPEPDGVPLSNDDLENSQGQGLRAAVVGALVGAIVSAGIAAVHYALDAAYDHFRHANVRDYVRTVKNAAIDGAVGGFVTGLRIPGL